MPTVESRDVSEATLRRLEAHAAEQGLSLSVYLARELERIAEPTAPGELTAPAKQATIAEMTARLRRRRPTRLSNARENRHGKRALGAG